jgi:DNA-binding CsgD family transcriptional regulator
MVSPQPDAQPRAADFIRTAAGRRTLQLLLTEASEKHIAHELGLTPSTVHQYVG